MLLLVNHFLQRTHCRRRTDLMPTYAPSWEQTSLLSRKSEEVARVTVHVLRTHTDDFDTFHEI
jgi:hypothetical protein